MGSLKLESYLLSQQRPMKSRGKDSCVIDYVWSQVRAQRGFKTYHYEKHGNEIYSYVSNPLRISTKELLN